MAVVKSAYRKKQSIQMTRLAQMADCEIGMLTTVLIGNSHTFLQDGLMITPRGYANKYDRTTGEAKDGEQAGRSLSGGLDDWKADVRERLARGESPEEIARHFDLPVVEIEAAMNQKGVHA